jgi:streptogramin lyase
MVQCKYCHTSLPDAANFCSACGKASTAQPVAVTLLSEDKIPTQRLSTGSDVSQTPTLQADPATPPSNRHETTIQPPPVQPSSPETPRVQSTKSDHAPDSGGMLTGAPPWFAGPPFHLPPMQEPMPALENYQSDGQRENREHGTHGQAHGSHQQPLIEHGPHQQPQMEYGSHQQPLIEYGPHHQPRTEHGPHQQPLVEYGVHHQAQAIHGAHHQAQAIHGVHQQAQVTHITTHVTTQATRKGIGHVVRHKILGTVVGKVAVGAVVAVVATGAALAALAPPTASAGKISEFSLPSATPVNQSTGITTGNGPVGIVKGPDGNLWFAEYATNKIGRITPGGNVTEFAIPTQPGGTTPELSGAFPGGIAAGPDGKVWFTEAGSHKIGRVTTNGEITEFPLPTDNTLYGYGSEPLEITTGPDGNLWFTEWGYGLEASKIGRITTNGEITEFPLSTNNSTVNDPYGTRANLAYGITAGPDGNLWFTEWNFNITGNSGGNSKIGRITPNGSITEFPLPTHDSGNTPYGELPAQITTGPDNNLWFTEYFSDQIGRITTNGNITEFPLPKDNSTPSASTPSVSTPSINTLYGKLPYGIVTGPDGNLWFTEVSGNQIGRISTSGSITEFRLSAYNGSSSTNTIAGNEPAGITVGPDNNLWFAEYSSNKIGVITSGK